MIEVKDYKTLQKFVRKFRTGYFERDYIKALQLKKAGFKNWKIMIGNSSLKEVKC